MFGLRQKLALGFGGVLAILVTVSALSIARLNGYSRTLETIFRENYDSVTYGQRMREAIEGMDDAAQASLFAGSGSPERTAADYQAQFQHSLDRELTNLTLPGERPIAESIAGIWKTYEAHYPKVFAEPSALTAEARLAVYRDALLPATQQIKSKAQQIIEMNLQNMVDTDGQVKRASANAKRAMYVLLATGVGLAVAFVGLMSRTMLQPLRALTKSAREIERGNLDLVVRVRSRDEVGQLGEAFNAMAAKLREFRRSDRARLARTERTTQLAVNSLPEAIAIVGPEGRVELANQTARRFFSLEPGTDVSRLPNAVLADLYARAAREGKAVDSHGYESAIQVFDTGGHERFFMPQAVPILDEDRTMLGITLVLADVTNLRRIDEMKSGMLSVVSHELKTPLTSFRMAVHLLLEERIGPLTPKQAEILLAAREDSERLHQIIENLLDLGRMQAGRALLTLVPTSPESLANDAAEPLRSAFADKGVKLTIDVSGDAPKVDADPDRLEHVFANLLTNALRYTPAGGTVAITVAPGEDGFVQFTVIDSGAGVPAEFVPRLFERFFRVPGQSGASGVGLGLAIAKDIVEAHGGRIWVENVPGGGARFCFTVRRAAQAEITSGPTLESAEGTV